MRSTTALSSPTPEVRTQARLDLLPVLAALGVRNPSAVHTVTGGFDTALWRVESEGRCYALRVFRADQAAAWHREAAVMPILLDLGLPVPSVHAAAITDDSPALLLSWCTGGTLLSELRRQPWRVWQLGTVMGRMQATIHSLHVTEALERSLPAWTPRLVHSVELEQLLRPTGRAASVLHLDYHPLNLMSYRGAITCVLDWPNAAIGDPRADLARTMALFRLAAARGVLEGVLARLLEAAWLRGYRQRRPPDALENLDPFCIWAAEMTESDLRPKLGRPGVWLTERDLERLRRWATTCRRRMAGTVRRDPDPPSEVNSP
jgi:aminoglycoside phosphotransferase (APT) family kinase protein